MARVTPEPPPPARPTESPKYLLKRAQAALHTALTAALREHGITLSQWAVLTVLDDEPGLSNADLARHAFVTPQTMNQILRDLEDRDWVTRHPHPGHGRILQSGLTEAGSAALRACNQAADAIEQRMLAGLTPGDRERLVAALSACIQALT